MELSTSTFPRPYGAKEKKYLQQSTGSAPLHPWLQATAPPGLKTGRLILATTMTEDTPNPICPTCGYDLAGTHQPGMIEPCPECGRKVSYQRAIEHPKHPRTILLALVFVLTLPTLWMSIFWAELNLDNSLDGALVPYFSGLLLTLYLPIASIVLLVLDWSRRKRLELTRARTGFAMTCIIVFAFLCIAMTWNWIVLMQWVEGTANV